jgi:hypothetical protein
VKVTIGKEGLTKTFQNNFPETVDCQCCCDGKARIAFVAHEGLDKKDAQEKRVYTLHYNEGKGGLWPHDTVCVAVYFCRECLEITAIYNQA